MCNCKFVVSNSQRRGTPGARPEMRAAEVLAAGRSDRKDVLPILCDSRACECDTADPGDFVYVHFHCGRVAPGVLLQRKSTGWVVGVHTDDVDQSTECHQRRCADE